MHGRRGHDSRRGTEPPAILAPRLRPDHDATQEGQDGDLIAGQDGSHEAGQEGQEGHHTADPQTTAIAEQGGNN